MKCTDILFLTYFIYQIVPFVEYISVCDMLLQLC